MDPDGKILVQARTGGGECVLTQIDFELCKRGKEHMFAPGETQGAGLWSRQDTGAGVAR